MPGILAVIVGAAANGLAIVVNGGWMPVWEPALIASGLGTEELNAAFHRLLPLDFGPEFFLRAGPLADIIPIPLPLITNVASMGDVFIGAGLASFVFSTLVRGKEDPQGGVSLGPGRRVVVDTGLGPGAADHPGRPDGRGHGRAAARDARRKVSRPSHTSASPWTPDLPASGSPRRSASSATGFTRWRSASSSTR